MTEAKGYEQLGRGWLGDAGGVLKGSAIRRQGQC
jgi:hypothetical protein